MRRCKVIADSWSQIPLVEGGFGHGEASEEGTLRCGREGRLARIRRILRRQGSTVAELSALSGRQYGRRSPYFIPPTFLQKLARGVTPHICQVVALSEVTGYRFVDWMHLCGFDLQQIPFLQMRLHTERTVLITPVGFERTRPLTVCNRHRYLSQDACNSHSPPGGPACSESRFLFAMIGRDDARSCPRLASGSLIRADRCHAPPRREVDSSWPGGPLWLVEHPDGLTCSQVRWTDQQQIVLVPSRPPWGKWPLRVPAEARILGLVDKIRPTRSQGLPVHLSAASRQPLCSAVGRRERLKLSDLLRVSRTRTGLTFREAHRLTAAIAYAMDDHNYAIALGLLSDYEAIDRLPRHIAKIISLCVAYCMDVQELLASAGVHVDDSMKAYLPTHDRYFEPHSMEEDYAGVTTTVSLGAGYATAAGSSL